MKQLWIDVEPGDVIQADDRIYMAHAMCWQPAPSDLVGVKRSACWLPVQRVVMQAAKQGPKKLKVTLEDRPIDIEIAQYKRMFEAACSALGSIGDALGVDPEEGGAEPILAAIAELKKCQTCEALARVVMMDQTSHDKFMQPPQLQPLTVWTEAQHERAYRNSPELHKDVKSLAAFRRVAKKIAAMYGITGGKP